MEFKAMAESEGAMRPIPDNWLHKFEPLPQLPGNEESREQSNEETGKHGEVQWPHWQTHKDCPACGGTGYVIEYDEKTECPMGEEND